jgi:hypothetical protein
VTRPGECIDSNVPVIYSNYNKQNWKNSKSIGAKLRVFFNKCLMKILGIFWPDQITNNELWKRKKQPRIDLQIRKRKWS